MKTLQTSANVATLVPLSLTLIFLATSRVLEAIPRELTRGFDATPDSATDEFQPILRDPQAIFALGFLRVNRSRLALSIIHTASGQPLWQPKLTALPWSKSTHLTFDGSLVLSDSPYWSTRTHGDRVVLLDTSNLQVLSHSNSVLWQSFDFPSDTLVSHQNFTAKMSLLSSNGLYSMKLGANFLGLHDSWDMYWKHTALEAKARIDPGKGPIYARVSPDGYLGMYQTEHDTVEVAPFDTFQRNLSGLTRLRLEPDGDLKAYLWTGSAWSLIYQAIQDACDLPDACGSYTLCRPSGGCSCLQNGMSYSSGGCSPTMSGDFCAGEGNMNEFRVIMATGVELPYKELRMMFDKMSSLEQCENSCAMNCTCWGAAYNNASGSCYHVDYPVRTLVSVGDEGKLGYFKMRPAKGKRNAAWVRLGSGAVGLVTLLLGFSCWGLIRHKRKACASRDVGQGHGVSQGSYEKLVKGSSFSSLEVSHKNYH